MHWAWPCVDLHHITHILSKQIHLSDSFWSFQWYQYSLRQHGSKSLSVFFYTNACQNFMSYLKQSPQNLFISLLQPPNPREDTKQINSPNRPLVPSHSTAVKPPLNLYYLLQFLKVRSVGCRQQNHPQSCQDALAKSIPTELKRTGNGSSLSQTSYLLLMSTEAFELLTIK